jgi:YOP proteins translocation protein K (YscK)
MTDIGERMESAVQTEAQRAIFRSPPVVHVHPRRVVDAFDGLIGEGIASKLLAEERFRDRLSELLAKTYALSGDVKADALSESARRLLLASGDDLMALVRRFGAIYWARAIASAIESSAVVALKEVLGDDNYAAALAHRALAGPDRALPDLEALDADITAAGLRCLAGWCSVQPAWIAQRIRLKVANGTELDGPVTAPFDEAGPRIVDGATV